MVRCIKDCAFLCANGEQLLNGEENGEQFLNSGSLDSGIDDILENELRLKDVIIILFYRRKI